LENRKQQRKEFLLGEEYRRGKSIVRVND